MYPYEYFIYLDLINRGIGDQWHVLFVGASKDCNNNLMCVFIRNNFRSFTDVTGHLYVRK